MNLRSLLISFVTGASALAAVAPSALAEEVAYSSVGSMSERVYAHTDVRRFQAIHVFLAHTDAR